MKRAKKYVRRFVRVGIGLFLAICKSAAVVIQSGIFKAIACRCSTGTVRSRLLTHTHTHTQVGKWDLIIAHPPCTKTSNAGAKHLWRGHQLNIKRYYEGLCGKALFMAIWKADCDKVVIENPIPSAVFDFPPHTQAIQPYEHGHPVSKKTLLWERGVPLLKPSFVVEPQANCHEAGTWFMKGGKERQKNRSKTFPGIAAAMAEQWG